MPSMQTPPTLPTQREKLLSSFRMIQDGFKKHPLNAAILFLLACGLLVRVALYLSTHYIVDDAMITFRYAAQIAAGNGFVYNTGERIYGTTTPLFALLLAGWRLLTNSDVISGAVLLNLAASFGTLVFVWMALRKLGSAPAQQVCVIALLALSHRIIAFETQGMETVWVAFFMAASWWAFVTGRIRLTGVFCGLLLWTRPDTFLWILALTLVSSRSGLRQVGQILLTCALVYLPWALFATGYFGSPIPNTITAKWVTYLQFNASPISGQIPIVFNYLSPVSFSLDFLRISLLAWLTVLICIWQSLRAIRNPYFNILSIFAVLEISRLILTKATFFAHYLYPALWVMLLILGLGLGSLQAKLFAKKSSGRLALFGLAMIWLLAMDAQVFLNSISIGQEDQATRNEAALKEAGLWLNRNTPPGASVMLEPLGYVGYYADRRMIDEAGLVQPGVTEMKRQGITDVYQYATAYHVDYIVAHCDEATGWLASSAKGEMTFAKDFSLAAKFNPLNFDPNMETPDKQIARDACYEIWGRKN